MAVKPSTWTPTRPKAIWGFNGTDVPGAVYLAAALAAHSQKGIPAFSIYGHDVQDADDTSILPMLKKNYCALPRRFGRRQYER